VETFKTVLEVVSFLLIAVGTFLRFDHWPGHDLVGTVESGVGFIGMIVAGIIDANLTMQHVQQRNDCYLLPPDQWHECLTHVGGFSLGHTLFEVGKNLLLALLAFALGWAVAKLIPGGGTATTEE
jgi:hypothetical protein